MKPFITFTLMMLAGISINAQLKVAAGTTLKTSGGATIVLQNLDLDNDGTINQVSGDGGFRFSGSQNAYIKGVNNSSIGILEINKSAGAKLLLNHSINVNSSISFLSGQLDLNGNNITLASTAYLAGESENNRIIGANGGYIQTTQDLNVPVSENPGFLGAVISSSANLGSVIIRRGHVPSSGSGLSSGIQRYYSIIPTNNNGLNATFRFNYFNAETNGKDENNFVLFQSNDNGANWINQDQSSRNIVSNFVEKSGLDNLSLFTLSEDAVNTCTATGVVLSVKNLKQSGVTVNWTTATESANQGFAVERRFANEANFSQIGFVNSTAPGGNSNSSINYSYADQNNPVTDTAYYRVKIVGLNASTCYSGIDMLAPKTKGGGGGKGGNGNGGGNPHNAMVANTSIASAEMQKKISIGPNPNNGNFWFTVSGLEKDAIAILYTIDGKQVQQFKVTNLQRQAVSNMRSGIYLLKVPGYDTQKIIVNGGSNGITQPAQSNNNNLKN